MRHTATLWLALVALGTLLTAACEDATTCTINSDCPADQTCNASGECVVECREQRDCAQGETCSGGQCLVANNNCANDSECLNGQRCIAGVCEISDAQADTSPPPDTTPNDTEQPDTGAPDTGQPDTGQPDTGQPDTGCTQGMTRCNSDNNVETCNGGQFSQTTTCSFGCTNGACLPATCTAGQRRCNNDGHVETCSNGSWVINSTCSNGCTSGQCDPPPSCTTGAKRCNGTGNVETCNGTSYVQTEICSNGCTGGVCDSTSTGQYGDPCDKAADCASTLCIGNQVTGVGMCTQICNSRTQCRGGLDQCLDAGGTKVCAPDDTGTSCDTRGPADCVMQMCIGAAGDQAPQNTFCSVFCNSAADCLPNHACSPAVCEDLLASEPSTQALSCLLTIVPFESPNREALLAQHNITARICVPLGQPNTCATGADAAQCYSALCDDSPSVCSGQCLQPADCPQGTCVVLDTSDSRIPIGGCDL